MPLLGLDPLPALLVLFTAGMSPPMKADVLQWLAGNTLKKIFGHCPKSPVTVLNN